jgi:hypothetical protein
MARTAEMVLGIIGGIFGIIIGLAEGAIGGLGEALNIHGATNLYGLAVLTIIASIIGIVGAALVGSKPRISGAVMLVAVVLGLIGGVVFFYILPAILLGIAGILALVRRVEVTPSNPVVTGKFCSNCGAPVETNVKFCAKCGSAIP